MYFLEINGKKLWPYNAIKDSKWNVKWDILPIIYDNADLQLTNGKVFYSLCYKVSKNLFWKELVYADLVDEESWETFSYQVKNIYFLRVFKDDIHMIARVWDELKYFSNFGRKNINIESDWDKAELTPLWYFDTFITYDDNYFYPLFLDWEKHNNYVKKFYDYYGYKAFKDESWIKHLYMLIEHSSSSEQNPVWYFVDNFEIISEKLYFDDYVEKWDVDADWDIFMETTNLNHYYILVGKSNKIVKWKKWNLTTKVKNSVFLFTRFFEDSDSHYIVWQRDEWFFVISKLETNITDAMQKQIVYYKQFLWFNKEHKFFIMQNYAWEIVLLDIFWKLVLTTDLELDDKIKDIDVSEDKMLINISLENGELRPYVV